MFNKMKTSICQYSGSRLAQKLLHKQSGFVVANPKIENLIILSLETLLHMMTIDLIVVLISRLSITFNGFFFSMLFSY